MSWHVLEALQRATQVRLPIASLLEYWSLGRVSPEALKESPQVQHIAD